MRNRSCEVGRSVTEGLSACLLTILVKSTVRIFMKILPEVYLWTRKSWLNIGSHPHLGPDLGIFKGLVPWSRLPCCVEKERPVNVLSRTTAATHIARPPGFPVRELPGIADPKIPGGNSREFLKLWRELRGIYRSFVFFPIFIVDYDILVFNLTHCIMCTTHDELIPPFEQNLEWRLWPNFLCIEFRYIFKYWYRKITEQRQIFANSDRYTNEDAEIIKIW